jgi:hypothetical protein
MQNSINNYRVIVIRHINTPFHHERWNKFDQRAKPVALGVRFTISKLLQRLGVEGAQHARDVPVIGALSGSQGSPSIPVPGSFPFAERVRAPPGDPWDARVPAANGVGSRAPLWN